MAADLPTVSPLLSLEGRANLISDEAFRSEHAGHPEARRAHVRKHALAHLRAALEQDRNTPPGDA